MTLILVCAFYAGISDVTSAVMHPPGPHYVTQDCAVYPSVKEAAIDQYGKKHPDRLANSGTFAVYVSPETFEGLQYYSVDTGSMKITKIKEPTVRLEVDEK